MSARRLTSRALPRLAVIAAVLAQLYFIVRGYSDPHKHFAFQPFNDFDVWRADIERVTYRGARVSVMRPWSGYSWGRLVGGDRGLDRPTLTKPASSGIESTLVFLQQALDFVAANTPRDRETHHYEATVYYRHNGGPESVARLESQPHFPSQEREP